ncbi:hypothetical protein [Variovorax sp. 160MFSha2.1]|uniref:hypothetical protein n=1 Tax=Variovorax sp. 160MFSha2.1 TaxID=3158367 RepID=UPI003AAAA89F
MSSEEMNFDLLDFAFVDLGVISINSLENGIYIGKFSPNDSFEKYKAIFLEYEILVESQQFSAVDEMDLKFASMGFFVISKSHESAACEIFDLQIMGGNISFRMASSDLGLKADINNRRPLHPRT